MNHEFSTRMTQMSGLFMRVTSCCPMPKDEIGDHLRGHSNDEAELVCSISIQT